MPFPNNTPINSFISFLLSISRFLFDQHEVISYGWQSFQHHPRSLLESCWVPNFPYPQYVDDNLEKNFLIHPNSGINEHGDYQNMTLPLFGSQSARGSADLDDNTEGNRWSPRTINIPERLQSDILSGIAYNYVSLPDDMWSAKIFLWQDFRCRVEVWIYRYHSTFKCRFL